MRKRSSEVHRIGQLERRGSIISAFFKTRDCGIIQSLYCFSCFVKLSCARFRERRSGRRITLTDMLVVYCVHTSAITRLNETRHERHVLQVSKVGLKIFSKTYVFNSRSIPPRVRRSNYGGKHEISSSHTCEVRGHFVFILYSVPSLKTLIRYWTRTTLKS